jgi:hypothetical protein
MASILGKIRLDYFFIKPVFSGGHKNSPLMSIRVFGCGMKKSGCCRKLVSESKVLKFFDPHFSTVSFRQSVIVHKICCCGEAKVTPSRCTCLVQVESGVECPLRLPNDQQFLLSKNVGRKMIGGSIGPPASVTAMIHLRIFILQTGQEPLRKQYQAESRRIVSRYWGLRAQHRWNGHSRRNFVDARSRLPNPRPDRRIRKNQSR